MGFAHFSRHGRIHLRRRGGTPVRLAAALARKGSSMALHSRYCLFLFPFSFFPFYLLAFRVHLRASTIGIIGESRY